MDDPAPARLPRDVLIGYAFTFTRRIVGLLKRRRMYRHYNKLRKYFSFRDPFRALYYTKFLSEGPFFAAAKPVNRFVNFYRYRKITYKRVKKFFRKFIWRKRRRINRRWVRWGWRYGIGGSVIYLLRGTEDIFSFVATGGFIITKKPPWRHLWNRKRRVRFFRKYRRSASFFAGFAGVMALLGKMGPDDIEEELELHSSIFDGDPFLDLYPEHVLAPEYCYAPQVFGDVLPYNPDIYEQLVSGEIQAMQHDLITNNIVHYMSHLGIDLENENQKQVSLEHRYHPFDLVDVRLNLDISPILHHRSTWADGLPQVEFYRGRTKEYEFKGFEKDKAAWLKQEEERNKTKEAYIRKLQEVQGIAPEPGVREIIEIGEDGKLGAEFGSDTKRKKEEKTEENEEDLKEEDLKEEDLNLKEGKEEKTEEEEGKEEGGFVSNEKIPDLKKQQDFEELKSLREKQKALEVRFYVERRDLFSLIPSHDKYSALESERIYRMKEVEPLEKLKPPPYATTEEKQYFEALKNEYIGKGIDKYGRPELWKRTPTPYNLATQKKYELFMEDRENSDRYDDPIYYGIPAEDFRRIRRKYLQERGLNYEKDPFEDDDIDDVD